MPTFALPPLTRAPTSVYYPGFAPKAAPARRTLRMGAALRLDVALGDQILLTNEDGGAAVWLAGFDPQRHASSAMVMAQDARPVAFSAQRCDADAFIAWVKSVGADAPPMHMIELDDAQTKPGAQRLLTIHTSGTLWCLLPRHSETFSEGGGGSVSLQIERKTGVTSLWLPEALGEVREEFRVERCTARAYRVKAGELIQIIDVEGRQCSDFMALREDALAKGIERSIDSTVTRTMVGGAYPGPGLFDKFFDQDQRPLLAVVQDTVGRHDTFALACTARGYEERGFPGHVNCSDNITEVFNPYGIAPRRAWPAINLFFNSWILPNNNRLQSDEAWSRPGDFVVLRALTDLVCVTTACPDDIDPINGWNPTDIHVRIYPKEQPIRAAIAYRPQTAAEPVLTQHSAFHPRTSLLTCHFAPARDVWLPVTYEATRALEEVHACREAVTVQDLSSLLKFDIMGPDAESLLQLCMTREVRKLSINRAVYALLCDQTGAVIDDGTLFRLAPDVFRWCCGSEHSALQLKEVAAGRGLTVWIKAHHQSMPNLAIQGPRSRDLLRELVFTQPTQPALESVKWFGFTIARLGDREGPAFMLTRTGYTGELGYEIFCDRRDALTIWDAVMVAGAPFGIKPMGGEALGMIRVEAGLAAHGAEFGGDLDAFEAGLGFAVDLAKEDFIGKAALTRIKAAPRRLLTGLLFSGNEVPAHGDGVFKDRQRIGTVTSATRSPSLGCAIALARVAVEVAGAGQALEVGRLDGHMKRLPCTTVPFPFVDPTRSRARA